MLWEQDSNGHDIQIQLPHIRLSGRLWGEEGKPLLLALHGWLDNANSFEPLSTYLNEFQVLAIDWPGHGYSEHHRGHYPLHWVDYIFDLDMLMTYLADKQAPIAILGHSLGGIVASAYAAAFPDKAKKLILIEALAPIFEPVTESKARLRKSFRSYQRYLAAQDKPLSVYDSFQVVINARHKLTGLDLPWCELLTKRNMEVNGTGVSWRSDPRLRLDSPTRLNFEQVDALMQGHPCPTLLITGSEGYKQLQTALPTAKKWFQDLSTIHLSGDHHLHMGNARGVADAINAFLL
ncbi:alpha/beta fold hydrolase [Shewanella surugensis]|uniref:Alpha/beta hydrolase n=1 Tax=Shewanella surugensis TaxID=212020 RepID=A0ABT0LC36_9GAMM|nr:alpha/beta hydrolase [Shewanella surugensis]MCL1125269.1 alpha/beta hydrolase [Shewanella surugensis]